MALKAGLVGVNPKGVDKNGMPIASGGSGVDEAQLTANGKKFFFAYDETSEKYGYKLDGAGDFIPFESAGGGPGWVAPADLTAEGLSYTRCAYKSGGYAIIDGNVYIDIIVTRSSTSAATISGIPAAAAAVPGSAVLSVHNSAYDYGYEYLANANAPISVSSEVYSLGIGTGTNGSDTHVWGCYPSANS